jgi:hypothetical protein
MTKDDDLALVSRKQVKHLPYTIMALTLHHDPVSSILREIQDLKNVMVFRIADGWGALYFPEMVHTQIMGNTHGPWQEFTFFRVAATTDGVNDPDENILENVLGKVFILDQQENRRVDLVFVTDDERFQG